MINFLGHPVVSGFTSGAAIVIGLSQLKHWFGVSVDNSQYVYDTIGNLWNEVVGKQNLRWMTLILGLTSYAALWHRACAFSYELVNRQHEVYAAVGCAKT